jgi:hypothetical protein
MAQPDISFTFFDRMSGFAVRGGDARWKHCARVVIAAVLAGNLVGLAGNLASSVYFEKYSQLLRASITIVKLNNTDDEMFLRASDQFDTASTIAAIQPKCEVAVLLLVIVAFFVAGLVSLRRISTALNDIHEVSDLAEQGRKLRLQILGILASVFVAFLLRSVLSTLKAVGNKHQQTSFPLCTLTENMPSEKSFCDAACYDDSTHIYFWLTYETSFEPVVQLIASPLTLLVALWGMTSPLTLQLMRATMRRDVHVALVPKS